MINDIYSIVDVVLNKENNGYVSPSQKNMIAKLVQLEIFKEYFSDMYRDVTKTKGSIISKGYGNLKYTQSQKISKFFDDKTITRALAGDPFVLPSDLFLIEEDGVISSNGDVVEEVERREFGHLSNSIAAADIDFPVYEKLANTIKVIPDTIGEINVRYIRQPKSPKWTYTIVAGKEMYDPSKGTFQDFELHESEFSNIVIRMCSYLGINLRESEVTQLMENLKNQDYIKENS